MDEKSRLLTIGQFAALHGVNKKTLMWYDEIGLFKPAFINPENGYRFYNYHQSSLFETILLLRELDVSINEIQEFMKNRSARSLKRLLDEKIMELDLKIGHLKAIRKSLCNHRRDTETLLNINLSEICLVDREKGFLATVGISQDISYDKTVEMVIEKTREYQLRHFHDASYGTMISIENLRLGNFNDYSGLFAEIPFPTRKTGLHIRPAGTYLRAFYQGDWDKLPTVYDKIFAYADKHHLALTGFSYETIINETVADCKEDYIVQIEIPARPLSLLSFSQMFLKIF